MNRKEREQAKVFEQVEMGKMSQIEASAKLGITTRWVRAKLKRYCQSSDQGLIHRSRGRKSGRKLAPEVKKLLIDLLRGEWHRIPLESISSKVYP